MRKILEALAGTAELMSKELSPGALKMMAVDLQDYPEGEVISALVNLRKTSGRFALDEIIKQIEKLKPDGRPGAEEAWAKIPRDEYASVVWTEEMANAFFIALPLLNEGDQIAARMAFKEAYLRLVEQSKRDGVAAKWHASLGHDQLGRKAVLVDAVQRGLLSAEQVAGLLPHSDDGIGIAACLIGNPPLQIESANV